MNFKTIMAGLLLIAGCTMTLSSCSSDDDNVLTESNNTVAPLKVSVASDETRVLIQDGNGKNTTVKMVWESGDALWAYSPDYENGDGTKGGYTRLTLESGAGANTAEFVAKGESHYVPGKPLFIYYHGGDQSASFASTSSDGSFLTITRPYDDAKNTTSSALFVCGRDAEKSVKDNPYFLRSYYMKEAPNDGVISNCVLKGNMTFIRIHFPINLLQGLTDALGTTNFKIAVAGQDNESNEYVFPKTVKLSLADGKLSQNVTNGNPLIANIGAAGLLNWTSNALDLGGGMVYVALPAGTYKNLKIEVSVSAVGEAPSLLGALIKANLLNKNFHYTGLDGKTFTIDINNETKNKADKVYLAGDVWSKFDVLLGALGSVKAGENWKIDAPSILSTK